jgi:type I restriction enzyme, S subunit
MAERYNAYPKYKNSRVKFIGYTPKDWEVKKFKYAVNFQEGPGILAKDFFDFGIPLLRIQNTKEEFVTDDYKTFLDLNTVNQRWKQFRVEIGDIIISCSASTGLVSEVDSRTVGSIPYTGLIRLRPKTNSITKDLIKYFVQSEVYHEQIHILQTGATIQHYGPIHLNQIFISIPDIDEQTQIANFLDHETSKIDTLIEKQQQLIKLLKEKRQAVISHAVTKGLNPDAPMKDSGVEWLDKIPEHWDILRLSFALKLQSGDTITSDSIENTGKYLVYGGNGTRGYTTNFNCDGEYVLIGRQGALCGNINVASGRFFASEHAIVVYPRKPFNTVYLAEILTFMDLGQYSVSAAQPGVSVERLDLLKVILPPENEQVEMSRLIIKEDSVFQSLSEQCESMISLLIERRTALISAAVTGKIDVRN